jgi:hypothetical protein
MNSFKSTEYFRRISCLLLKMPEIRILKRAINMNNIERENNRKRRT